MNGTYRISLRTPLGMQNGMISFVQDGESLSGFIRTMGKTNHFKNGKVKDNSFHFSGMLNAGLLNINYNANGMIVEGNKLKATARTNFGAFQIWGAKVE